MHTSNRSPSGPAQPLSRSGRPPQGGGDRRGGSGPVGERDDRLARRVARAASSFEHALLGRSPTSVTVVGRGGWMVIHVQMPFSHLERRLAREDVASARRVAEFHRRLFDQSIEALCEHVHRTTGVEFHAGLAHVDAATGSILKTLATEPQVDVFLMGRGLPTLGVPVNSHLRAGASELRRTTSSCPDLSGMPGMQPAAGNGAVRR